MGLSHDIMEEFKYSWLSAYWSSYQSDHQEKNDNKNAEFDGQNYDKFSENKEFKKPYDDSWFSPEAHKDLKILRKEYNFLAKKYHPDNNPNGKDVFINIQQERCTIIDSI